MGFLVIAIAGIFIFIVCLGGNTKSEKETAFLNLKKEKTFERKQEKLDYYINRNIINKDDIKNFEL